MSTPDLYLSTAFVVEAPNRITVTCEPNPSLGPRFILARGATTVSWAVRADVSAAIASELDGLAREEKPHGGTWETPPSHEDTYRALLAADDAEFDTGPVFEFPEQLPEPGEVATVRTERELAGNFFGWVQGEISGGRSPVFGVVEAGAPVSICFCARRTQKSALAGVETVERYRRRGYAARVTSAWAAALRSRRVTPLYGTSWSNDESLALARKLGLATFATTWTAS